MTQQFTQSECEQVNAILAVAKEAIETSGKWTQETRHYDAMFRLQKMIADFENGCKSAPKRLEWKPFADDVSWSVGGQYAVVVAKSGKFWCTVSSDAFDTVDEAKAACQQHADEAAKAKGAK